MNVATKQKLTHRLAVAEGEGGEERVRMGFGVSRFKLLRVDKQQGLALQHWKLYSISCDKP